MFETQGQVKVWHFCLKNDTNNELVIESNS